MKKGLKNLKPTGWGRRIHSTLRGMETKPQPASQAAAKLDASLLDSFTPFPVLNPIFYLFVFKV